MTPPTPARRDAATGDTTMRTQEPTMTEHDTTDAIETIRSALYQWVPDGDLAPAIDAIDALAARLAAETIAAEFALDELNRVTRSLDVATARLAAAEAERVAPEVWAVIQIEADDHAVGEPLSYHWDEESARKRVEEIQQTLTSRRYVARRIHISGDLPETGGGKR